MEIENKREILKTAYCINCNRPRFAQEIQKIIRNGKHLLRCKYCIERLNKFGKKKK